MPILHMPGQVFHRMVVSETKDGHIAPVSRLADDDDMQLSGGPARKSAIAKQSLDGPVA
jgi:hypothetical protein